MEWRGGPIHIVSVLLNIIMAIRLSSWFPSRYHRNEIIQLRDSHLSETVLDGVPGGPRAEATAASGKVLMDQRMVDGSDQETASDPISGQGDWQGLLLWPLTQKGHRKQSERDLNLLFTEEFSRTCCMHSVSSLHHGYLPPGLTGSIVEYSDYSSFD